VDQNRQKKRKLTNAIIAIFALGCADVFFVVGMLGGFKISSVVGVAILALFVLGCVCEAVYVVLISATRPTAHPKKTRLPLRGGEWWTR
jgi:uncharacterized membrane protein